MLRAQFDETDLKFNKEIGMLIINTALTKEERTTHGCEIYRKE